MQRMTREDPQLKIRLPAALKAKIETAAQAASRTINAEVVSRLQQSFDAGGLTEALRQDLLEFVNAAIDERIGERPAAPAKTSRTRKK